jgi:aldoxime dehydratase
MKTEIEGQIFHPVYERVISARRPPNFTPPSVRYSLRWRRPVPELVADWFGIQGPELGSPASRDFVERIRTALSGDFSPDAIEIMVCPRDEAGQPVTIVVAYWTSTSAQANWSVGGDWAQWWESPDRLHDGVGYWRETLVCPYDRFETIYSQNTYRIGFGRTPGSEIVKITDNGYFGAARDRLPISAVDEVKSPLGVAVRYDDSIDPRGRRVLVFTPLNTLVMRSGQFWHNSELEQAQDYESSLRPKLDRGMDYLAAHPDTGCIYLRQMINVEDDFRQRRETSVYAAFQDYAGLELWAGDHPTHQAIYEHQIAMGRKYGPRRDVITWHEAFVLPANNRFEYINCAPRTGMTRVGPLVSYVH